jgi:ribose transport system substrate-binding protein
MRNKSVYALALAVILFALAPGCRSSGKLRLAFVTNNASDFWKIAEKGTQKAAQELGNVEVEFRVPGAGDASEQKRIVDDLMAKGIDGMAISPVDPANQTQMINDVAKQVAVITQDSDAPQSSRACYIGTDNRAAGRQAGELVKQALPQGGKIMVFVGKADAQNARDRFEGLKEALQGSNVQVVDLRTDDADPTRAKSNAETALVSTPDLAGMVGLWAYNAPAILSAVRAANKVGKVKIIAFDEQDETLQGVQEGSIEGTVVQQPFEFGYQSIKALARIKDGDRSMIPETKQIFVPTKIIRKDNVEEFRRQLNQLLGRG